MYNCVFRLFTRILFEIMYRVERQILKFSEFVNDSSPLKKCRWTEINCAWSKTASLRSVSVI